MTIEELAELRLRLVAARTDLRLCQDDYHACRLRAELGLGESVEWDTKRLGSNAEDRKRSFDAAVEADADCRTTRATLRTLEAHVLRLEAELDCALDIRREREWTIRERLSRFTDDTHIGSALLDLQQGLPL